jgi:phosphohistidine phosphatase
MKSILILRHGKSDWSADYSEDHERPVAKRGRRAAKQVGRFLTEIGQVPDLVLSSSASRAQQTAELAIGGGGWTCPITSTWELYAATVPATVKIIQSQDDAFETLMLVGHQPTWSELIAHLVGGGEFRFPTAALARIEFGVDSWSEIQANTGTLVWFMIPKLLVHSGLKSAGD